MTHSPYEGYGDPLALILLRHALERPGSLAAQDDMERLTYAELYERVAATAGGLWSFGVRPGDRVALRLSNSVGFLSVALACLWLGAPFVPISIDDPEGRVEQILTDNDPALAVVEADRTAPGLWGRTVVGPDELMRTRGPVPERAQDPERDAYMIYTSGTTGSPKGVQIPVSSFGWSISATADGLGLDHSTRSLCVSPFHFDGSYTNLFPTLVAGGCVVIPKARAAAVRAQVLHRHSARGDHPHQLLPELPAAGAGILEAR